MELWLFYFYLLSLFILSHFLPWGSAYCFNSKNLAIFYARSCISHHATILKKMRVKWRTTRSLWLPWTTWHSPLITTPRCEERAQGTLCSLPHSLLAGVEMVGAAPAQTWALSSSLPTLSTIWTPVTGRTSISATVMTGGSIRRLIPGDNVLFRHWATITF